MSVTSNARAAHKELMRIWGQKPFVFRHADESENHDINIAHCDGSPVVGVTAVGTVGLSDHDLGLGPLRIELIGAFPASFEEAPNVAATCAFNSFKDGWLTRPDAVHADVIGMYRPSTTVPHALLTDPFLWADGPQTLNAGEMKIAWLMIVPIAETELRFAKENGVAALKDLFELRQIDIYDLEREPVV